MIREVRNDDEIEKRKEGIGGRELTAAKHTVHERVTKVKVSHLTNEGLRIIQE